MTTALLCLAELEVTYRMRRRAPVRAVVGVSLGVGEARTMALIGESGSGKSSIARAICGLAPVSGGAVLMGGRDLAREADRPRAAGESGIQIVFQDPVGSLDPRWPVWRSVAEPRLARFRETAEERRRVALRLLDRVGLGEVAAGRRPHHLSGGQRQRATIARALAAEPRLVILDEAVSALDVSVRNEVLVLLDELKRERGLTYLFISHDMGAVAQMASDVAVLYLSRLVEVGEAGAVIHNPVHPYTRALIAAVPSIHAAHPKEARAAGEIDDPANPPPGCRFHRRCAYAVARCREDEPAGREYAGRTVACHRAEDVDRLARDGAATT